MQVVPIGTVFGRWTTESLPEKKGEYYFVKALCSCGTHGERRLTYLKNGDCKSCGCLKREVTIQRNKEGTKHAATSGTVFGRLTVINSEIREKVLCSCSCGKKTQVNLMSLVKGVSKSCGCLRSELVAAKNYTHGGSYTAMYTTWRNIKERCYSKNNPSYHNYGGRGIKMSEPWQNFEQFYADVGEPPFAGATLDRKNNDGNYCRDNVRWATKVEQSENTRRNKRYPLGPKEYLLKEIQAAFSIPIHVLYYRVNTSKQTLEQILKLKLTDQQILDGLSRLNQKYETTN